MHRFLIGILVLMLCFGTVSVGAQEVAIITEENPPFSFLKEGEPTGAATAVVQEIMRRLDLENPILVLPWARSYKRLQTEANIGLFLTARTPEREAQFQWVGPLYTVRTVFYARTGSGLKIESMEDAKKVGSIATYKDDYREQILISENFSNIDSSKNPQSNLRKLISGRVDLWISDNIISPRIAAHAGIDPDAIEEVFEVRVTNTYIAFSLNTPESVVDAWQATLDQMKADGAFWWLSRKWLPADAVMMAPADDAKRPSGRLRIFTEDSPPSTYMENGKLAGLSAEIVQEMLGRLKLKNKIEMVPWARGYKLALNEPGVVLFSTTRLPQREDLFQWVGPLYTQTWGLYKHKGSAIHIKSLEDAKKVARIGTYRQDAKMQYLSGLGFKNLVPTNRNINNILHLVRDDIDLWVSSDFNMVHLAQQAGVDPHNLELAYPFHKVGNYIAFSKTTSPHIVHLWQQVLDEIKSDGVYDRICDKYVYHP
jgi:polar amino acid transport system substrate-binding protein